MPVTATFSSRVPAAGSTFQNYDGWHEVVVTPSNVLNPVASVSLEHNGVVHVATFSSLGPSGAVLARVRGFGRANAANAVEWTATTQDANPNLDAYAYDTRPAYPATRGDVDHTPAVPPYHRAVVDHTVAAPPHTRAAVDSGVQPSGLRAATRAAVEYGVAERSGGFFGATPAMVDYYATEKKTDLLITSGAVPGEHHHDPVYSGAAIDGTDRRPLVLTGASVHGSATETALLSGAELNTFSREQLLLTGAAPAEVSHTQIPSGAAIEPVDGRLTVELSAVSTAEKTATDEED